MNRRGLLKLVAAAPAAAALGRVESPAPVVVPEPEPEPVSGFVMAAEMAAKSAYVQVLISNRWISVESAREVLGLDA